MGLEFQHLSSLIGSRTLTLDLWKLVKKNKQAKLKVPLDLLSFMSDDRQMNRQAVKKSSYSPRTLQQLSV